MRSFAVFLMVLCLAAFAEGQEMSKADAGSALFNVDGRSVGSNKDSSLRREWVAVHDENLPLMFVGTPGVERAKGNAAYSARTHLTPRSNQTVTAVEINFVLLDLFGECITTLSATRAIDIAAGEKKTFNFKWNVYGEEYKAVIASWRTENKTNFMSKRFFPSKRFLTSIAFIAKVRTTDGQVHLANIDTAKVVTQFIEEGRRTDE